MTDRQAERQKMGPSLDGRADPSSSRSSDAPPQPQPTPDAQKSRWRLLKEQKKSARKAKREEEFLKALHAPKDTKVVLADRCLVERLMAPGRVSPAVKSPTAVPGFSTDSKDFPALTPGGSGVPALSSALPQRETRMSYRSAMDQGWRGAEEFVPLGKEKARNKKKKSGVVTDQARASDAGMATGQSEKATTSPLRSQSVPSGQSQAQQQPGQTTESRKKNSKDPTTIDLGELLIATEKAKKKKKKERKNVVLGSKYRARVDSTVLRFNALDSSKPKQSRRGKRRVHKKKKLTKLKLSILRDRIVKTKGLARDLLTDRDSLREELAEYMAELARRKAEAEATNGKSGSKRRKNVTQYRKYCDNKYSRELDKSVEGLVHRIVFLQGRARSRNAMKARAKQRYVVGLREVKKYLMLKKVKLLFVAPDLEAQRTMYDQVDEVKAAAQLQGIPCGFVLSRRKLGFILRKWVPVSAFAVLNYEGLEEEAEAVREHLKSAQERLREARQREAEVAATSAGSSAPPAGNAT